MDTAGGRGTWPGEGPTPFRGWRQSVRVVDSRRYRAIAGRTACVCAAERGSREEMGRCAIPTFNLRPQEFDEVKKLNLLGFQHVSAVGGRSRLCGLGLIVPKRCGGTPPSSPTTDGWGWKRCQPRSPSMLVHEFTQELVSSKLRCFSLEMWRFVLRQSRTN